MITEKSCGAVVFTRINSQVKYVIIESKGGIFGFPKGHMERDESERETALREVYEETGLKVELIDGFLTEDNHTFMVGSEIRMKHIVYFLGEYDGQSFVAQEAELNGIYLLDYLEAIGMLQFESSKRILTEANSFIQN